ncbi:CDP-glycerol glycerophosphotransferase family protein [Caballeronia sp. Lep1P3]|uniref:CDP-glycerol glycerophosphotransferase family protein n=1 Tax=Caballeronia sp. Lep1P3 TaxID=2878150 RepID=UPI001FD58B15|nr:CDP-glycerol glycerophosphotransferase family protein [Caballeronia sp. Lep1P3]
MNLVATYKKAKKRYGVFLLNRSAANLQWIAQRFPKWDNPRYLRGLCLLTLGKTVAAEQSLREAIALNPTRAHAQYLLGLALSNKNKWWQAVAAFEAAVHGSGKQARWHYELGKAREHMKRFDGAAEAFADAVALKPKRSVWQYRLGRALERAGNLAGAEKAYATATKLDASGQLRRHGVGAWHQKDGLWMMALGAYAKRLRHAPESAELRYRLGLANERSYEWDAAETCYRRALLLLRKPKADWSYRLAFVLERQQKWGDAAQAYNASVIGDATHRPYRNYRLGYVLSKAGDHRAACAAFLNSRKNVAYVVQNPTNLGLRDRDAWHLKIAQLELRIAADATDQNLYVQLARAHEAMGDWEAAARAYRAALLRCSDFKSDWYYRLGRALTQAGRYEEACEAFIETVVFKLPHGVDERDYKSVVVVKALQYSEYYETLAVTDNVILYESFGGNSMSCNPYAMFKRIVDDPHYRSWLHIWVLNDRSRIPHEYRTRNNVVFVAKDSDRYRRHLASAKYLVNNSTFPPYFIRKETQRYLNTWHGTPLKAMGLDISNNFMEHRNSARNLLQASHMLSPNAHTSRILLEKFDVASFFPGKMLEAGYPRIDATLNLASSAQAALRERLGLSTNQPVVLYAPTWRGVLGKEQVEFERLAADLKRLGALPCQVLFKGHNFVEKKLAGQKTPGISVVPGDIDANELLSIVDILVTDYSSIFFDFIPTQRPILYYTYDYEQYAAERGLYFDFGEMPGTQCFDIDALCSKIAVLTGSWPVFEEQYEKAIARFCPYDDGNATDRAIDFFLRDANVGKVITARHDRPRLLFFGGHFAPNGITSSFVSLLNGLRDAGRHDVVALIDSGQVAGNPVHRQKFADIAGRVPVVARAGAMTVTLEERRIVDRSEDAPDGYMNAERKSVQARAFRREFRRMFGESGFDAFVQFDGYSHFWTSLLAEAGTPDNTRLIYLHNNMIEECRVRFPKLESLFGLYDRFDKLISVSASVHEQNLSALARRFSLDPGRFEFLNNTIDADRVLKLADEEVDPTLTSWIGASRVVVTVGRLSPEKGQEKLIRAFAKVRAHMPDVKLVIVGEGPQRAHLEGALAELGATGYVRLAGGYGNPFPIIQRADAFILSSDHEGQGLVLLEALTLGKQVVSTDIPGPHSVLEGGYGLLVENTESGVVHGLTELLNGWTAPKRFDTRQYQAEALRAFMTLIERYAPAPTDVLARMEAQVEPV